MAQIRPEPIYDHRLAERVITYLQTRDVHIFPFTRGFTVEQQQAFIRDLREGLAELTDSGSARKSSAAGFILSDERLHGIVAEWSYANGGWPRGADPRNAHTDLGSISDEDEGPTLVPGAPVGRPR